MASYMLLQFALPDYSAIRPHLPVYHGREDTRRIDTLAPQEHMLRIHQAGRLHFLAPSLPIHTTYEQEALHSTYTRFDIRARTMTEV